MPVTWSFGLGALMLEPPGEAFERCPRCRLRRDGYSVFRCPACGLVFCAGCDRPDLPVRGLGWLEAAVAEADRVSCPACTAEAEDEDRVGYIAGPEPSGDKSAEPGAADAPRRHHGSGGV